MQFDIQLPVTITLSKLDNFQQLNSPCKTLYSLQVIYGKGDEDKQIIIAPIYSDSPEELFNRLFKILIDNKIYTPQQ